MSTTRKLTIRLGDHLTGLVILKQLNHSTVQDELRFWVRYDCCGREGEIVFATIYNRLRNGRVRCADCGSRIHKRAVRTIAAKPDLGWQLIDELPIHQRPRVPSVEEVMGLYAAAEKKIRARRVVTENYPAPVHHASLATL